MNTTEPSKQRASARALRRAARNTKAHALAIRDTLAGLDDALGDITPSDGSATTMGLAGLPIMAVIKTVRKVASELVRQRTDRTLEDWTSIIDSTILVFDDYVQLLDEIIDVTSTGRPPEEVGKLVHRATRQTMAWRGVLDPVSKLGDVIDAVWEGITTSTQDQATTQQPEGVERGRFAGIRDSVQSTASKIGEATGKGLDGAGQWRQLLLGPIREVAQGVQLLPERVQQMSDEVEHLEVLLDLVAAQEAVGNGSMTPHDASVVATRTTLTIDLPDAQEAQAVARENHSAAESRVRRLSELVKKNQVDSDTAQHLSALYDRQLREAMVRLDEAEEHLRELRLRAATLLARAMATATERIRILKARRMVEQTEEHDYDLRLLERELVLLDRIERLEPSSPSG